MPSGVTIRVGVIVRRGESVLHRTVGTDNNGIR